MKFLLGEDTYLAGIWKGNVLYNLLRFAVSAQQRSDEYNIPLWSWASMPGRVSHPLTVTDIDYISSSDESTRPFKDNESDQAVSAADVLANSAQVLDFGEQLSNSCGSISGGYILLSGAWYEVQIEGNHSGKF
jgi:hypothetical protein